MDTRHNYVRKILTMIERGELPTLPDLSEVSVYHDDSCAIFEGGFCNCDPTVEYWGTPVEEQQEELPF